MEAAVSYGGLQGHTSYSHQPVTHIFLCNQSVCMSVCVEITVCDSSDSQSAAGIRPAGRDLYMYF